MRSLPPLLTLSPLSSCEAPAFLPPAPANPSLNCFPENLYCSGDPWTPMAERDKP